MPKYLCPLCQNNVAYVSEYGLADSVICKCQGLKEVGRLNQGIYQPHNFSNSKAEPTIVGLTLTDVFVFGDFAFAKLKTEKEVEDAGHRFQNALSHDSMRKNYMQKGDIWVANHQLDKERSIIFLINKQKKLENFYLRANASPSPQDRAMVEQALKQKGLIV